MTLKCATKIVHIQRLIYFLSRLINLPSSESGIDEEAFSTSRMSEDEFE